MKCPTSYVQGGWARRSAPLVLCSVLLGACALPMPVKVASWVADGIAYLTTEKSVTDLGISLVAQQDCALWRGLSGEQICRSEDGTAIAMAAAEGPPAGNAEGGYSSDDATLMALALAAGPADPDAAAFWAADESCGGYGECRQGEGRPEQPPDLVLARRPAVVRRRRDPGPASEATHVAAIESPFPPHQALTEPYDEAAGSPPPAATPAVATADGQPPAGGADSANLGAITTASGPIEDGSMDLAMLGAEFGLLEPAEPQSADLTTASAPAEETAPPSGLVQPATAIAAGDTPGAPGTVDHVQPAATADRLAPRRERVPAAMVGSGLYYVIGACHEWNNVQRVAARHGTLAPSVVTGKLDGRKVFRVVIGPFDPSEQEDMRALIRRAGIYDAWAVRMNSAEWSVARSTGTARNRVHSIAQLTKPSGF